MPKNKFILMFMTVMLGLLAIAVPVSACPTGDPVALPKCIANNMIDGLKANRASLKTKPNVVYKLAYEYVVPYANLDEMSKRVLPPRIWNSATSYQQEEFKKLFTRTVIRTYASALSNYQDQTIQFFPLRTGQGNSVEVRSQIISSSREPINVTYRLVRTTKGWQLYDMSVEGVSMLSSFRSQFADILSRGDMSSLLNRLSGHAGRY